MALRQRAKGRIVNILEKVVAGSRISPDEAIKLLKSHDLTALGKAAHIVRMRLHPEQVVTYVVDRNINYSNVCISRCKFCAFWCSQEDGDAYLLSREELREKLKETVEQGGSQILLQGGLHPELPLDYYCDMLRYMKDEFGVHLHAFSPPEIVHFAKLNRLSIKEVLKNLRNAGLGSIPGGGAEVLSDRCRKELSPKKCSVKEWLDVMRAAHKLGIRTTATMMFGHIETLAERVEHLEKIRALQDETGGFTAFIPWTYQPQNTALGGTAAGGFEYLKMLAVSRIYLDNVPNIQASWVTQGEKIAQVALYFGANDMGSTMLEENVVRAAGCSFRLQRSEIERLIRDAGFSPSQRNYLYEPI